MDIAIDNKGKLKITNCSTINDGEIRLIYLYHNDKCWEVYKYSSDDRHELPHDGEYICYEKGFDPEIAENLLTSGLNDVKIAFNGANHKSFFSISKFRDCVLTLEKETLLNYSAKCSTSVKSEDKKLRDLLMIAIFVLENLICDDKRYPEAQEILDSMWNECGHFCSKVNNNCNCK